MPPGLDGPVFQKELADSWYAMDRDLGANRDLNPKAAGVFTGIVEIPAGWKTPPSELLNTYRSFYIRTEQEDEQDILISLSHMKPRQLQFRTHMFAYGAPYIYSVGAALALGAAAGLVTLKGSLLVYLNDPAKMAAMYLAGRLLSVAAYLACALMIFRLGRLYAGLEAGALGAALFLMTPAAVTNAHTLKIHIFWAFFVLWTVDRCALVLKRGALKDYAAAGAVAGLTTVIFLGAWPVCLVVGAAGALRLAGLHEPNGRPRAPVRELQGLVLSALCAVAAFFLSSPYWIIDFGEGLAVMKVVHGALGGFDFTHPVLFVRTALSRSVTEPVLTLMFGGTVLALFKGKREPVLLLCGIAFLLALASWATVGSVVPTIQARYFLGWIGVGSLLAGRLLQELRALKGTAGRLGTATAAIVLAGLACQGISYAHNFYLGESDRSDHFLAGDWIEKNIPAGETIGFMRYPQPTNSPFFRFDRYRLEIVEPKLASALAPERLPRWLALTAPDFWYDRSALGPNLSRYELKASFSPPRLFPWVAIDPTSGPENPVVEVYRLIDQG